VQGIERQILPDAQDTLRLSEVYRQFAREHPTDVVVADLAGLVCPQGPRCPERLDGVVLRPDSTHYETEGAVWTAPRLLDLMSLALVRRPLPS
jgi:hypothetical protein